MIAAILLGLAALLTAYAAWQSANAGGDAVNGCLESNKLTTQAADLNGLGDQEDATNQALFLQYILAEQAGNPEISEYVLGLFNEDAQETVAAWAELPEDESPPTPFHADNPGYTNSAYDEAAELTDQADKAFAAAADSDEKGGKFDIATVFLAVTLFFAGIATLFKEDKIQYALLLAAGLLLAGGTVAQGIAQTV